jgi:hypothetical protein
MARNFAQLARAQNQALKRQTKKNHFALAFRKMIL